MPNSVIMVWKNPKEPPPPFSLDPELYELVTPMEPGQTSIEYSAWSGYLARLPLLDDITLDITTSFQKASSLLGGFLSNILDLMSRMQAAGAETNKFQMSLDMMVWKETNPIKMTFDVMFYVKDNPLEDVLKPVMSLVSMTALTVVTSLTGKTKFKTPGVAVGAMNQLNDNVPSSGKPTGAGGMTVPSGVQLIKKIDYLRIPGVIKLRDCLVESAKPTFSKEKTMHGVPIWCKLNLTIMTAYPALDSMLESEIEGIDLAQKTEIYIPLP